ncbi:MAG: PDZ domain-containing protein [candidate division Zixibacteria bacterium]|nr:PDZ domain-containing protein [candidate division Zixibacteria bacterium]
MPRFVILFLLLFFPLSGVARSGSLEEDLAELIEKVRPSIVKIRSEAGGAGGAVSPLQSTLAFGLAFDSRHVVTTADVERLKFFSIISNAESVKLSGPALESLRISVETFDGRELKARLVASDRMSNLAVLEVEEGGLHPTSFGNSTDLKIGSLLIVPNSGMAKASSATFGPLASFRVDGSLLLDVSILPGASGAPVLNSKGEVVGLVTGQTGAPLSLRTFRFEKEEELQRTSQPVELPVSGQAIAVSSNQLQKLAAELVENKRVARPFMGVYPQDLDPELKDYHNVEYGVLVSKLVGGGPAERAGLKQGDVVLSLDGRKMESENEFRQFLNEKKPGDVIQVKVMRKGRERNFKVSLGDRSDVEETVPPLPSLRSWWGPEHPQPLTPAFSSEGFLGVTASDLTDRQKRRHNIKEGAYVEEISEGSPAEKAGIKTDDIVTAFDGKPVSDADDLYQKIRKSEPGKEIPVEILRRGERRTLNVTLADRSQFDLPSPGPGEREFRMFRFGERSAFLGVTTQRLSQQEKENLQVEGGARVVTLASNSAASKAGLREGDVIISVDGKNVFSPEDLSEHIGARKPGDRVEIAYLREGVKHRAQAELDERPGFERFFGRMGPDGRMDWVGPFDQRERKIEDLEKQLEELRRSLDSLRKERK